MGRDHFSTSARASRLLLSVSPRCSESSLTYTPILLERSAPMSVSSAWAGFGRGVGLGFGLGLRFGLRAGATAGLEVRAGARVRVRVGVRVRAAARIRATAGARIRVRGEG